MRLYFLTLLLFCFAILPTSMAIAAAPDIAPQPCDARYWEQMSSRAWMEAQREIMQNQNLIFKPDSVLEYACFDQFASVAAWAGGQIFTHTTYFGNMIIPRGTNESMEVAITNVVTNALNQYVNQSFGHDFLGGRAGSMNITDKDSQLVPAVDRVGYTCNVMKNVWQTAKCANFIDNEDFETDGFHPFETLQGHNGGPPVAGYDDIQETRAFPQMCGVAAGPGGSTIGDFGPAGTWLTQTRRANNTNLYPYQEPLQEIFSDVFDKTAPLGTSKGDGTAVTCSAPIATGMTINPSFGGPYLDGVCTNPGCMYVRGESGGLGSCLQISGPPEMGP